MTPRPFQLILTGSLDWQLEAACRGMDPDLFFPSGKGSTFHDESNEAKKVCAVCPVRPECLDYAIANRERHGIWAGHGREERLKIAKHRRTA
jgi:WhiB family redox-sensing transcriptional regulator